MGSHFKSSHPDQKSGKPLTHSPLDDSTENCRVTDGSRISLGDSLFQVLEEFSKEKKMLFSLPHAHLDYVPPKLHRGKTSWYISYYVKNPATGKMKLFRVKVNRYHNQKERIQARRWKNNPMPHTPLTSGSSGDGWNHRDAPEPPRYPPSQRERPGNT